MTILLFLLLQDPLDPFPKVRVPVPVLKPAQTVPLNTVKAGPVQEIPAKPKDEPKITPKVKVRDYWMRPEVAEVEKPRGSFLIKSVPGSAVWEAYPKWETDDPPHAEGLENTDVSLRWQKLPWAIPDSGELLLWEPPLPWKQWDNSPRIYRYIAVEFPDTGTWMFNTVVFRKGQRGVPVDLRRGK